jgi:hypothetical protein
LLHHEPKPEVSLSVDVKLSLLGTVVQIEYLGARARKVWPVGFDQRFVVVVRIESAETLFVVGSEVCFAIHSVAQSFMTGSRDLSGRRYHITLLGKNEGERYQFSWMQGQPLN